MVLLAFVLAIADLNSARHSDWFAFGILGVSSSSILGVFFNIQPGVRVGCLRFLRIGLDDERFLLLFLHDTLYFNQRA